MLLQTTNVVVEKKPFWPSLANALHKIGVKKFGVEKSRVEKSRVKVS